MKKTYAETCLIEVKIGDRVQNIESKQIGIVKDIRLLPNTRWNVEGRVGIVAILFIQTPTGVCSATADKFRPLQEDFYEECYPSVIFSHLGEER